MFDWCNNAGWSLFSLENILLPIFSIENRCHYCLTLVSLKRDRTRDLGFRSSRSSLTHVWGQSDITNLHLQIRQKLLFEGGNCQKFKGGLKIAPQYWTSIYKFTIISKKSKIELSDW